jgi:multiple sugar transport system substrate-binding protein
MADGQTHPVSNRLTQDDAQGRRLAPLPDSMPLVWSASPTEGTRPGRRATPDPGDPGLWYPADRVGHGTSRRAGAAEHEAGRLPGRPSTFIGLNNAGYHNNIFRPLSRAGRSSPGPPSSGSTCLRPRPFAKVQQGVATGEIEFDVMEGGAPWEGDILGRASPWRCRTMSRPDRARRLRAPPPGAVGTWEDVTYRVSIDGDCHNFNYRTDVFSSPERPSMGRRRGRRRVGRADHLAANERRHPVPQRQAARRRRSLWIPRRRQTRGGFTWYFFASRATAYAKHPTTRPGCLTAT